MKNYKSTIFFSFCLVLIASFSVFAQDGNTGAPKKTETSKIPEGEAVFTEEQLKEYYLVYTDPDVKYLRKVFNAYLSSKKLNEEEKDALVNAEKTRLKSKFVVLSREAHIMGGQNLIIVFQSMPDKIFNAWIYNKGKNNYVLRVFEENKTFSEEDLKRMKTRYRRFLEDKEHAM